MRIARLSIGLILAVATIHLQAQQPGHKITVTGKLVSVMAIGGESTGWAVELESAATIDGKRMNSIQISYPKPDKLEKLRDKRVSATGQVIHRHGVETGEQT